MRTITRPLPAFVLLASLAGGAAACESGTPPEAPAEIEQSIEESGPEVVEDDTEGEQGLNEGATEGASATETEGAGED